MVWRDVISQEVKRQWIGLTYEHALEVLRSFDAINSSAEHAFEIFSTSVQGG